MPTAADTYATLMLQDVNLLVRYNTNLDLVDSLTRRITLLEELSKTAVIETDLLRKQLQSIQETVAIQWAQISHIYEQCREVK